MLSKESMLTNTMWSWESTTLWCLSMASNSPNHCLVVRVYVFSREKPWTQGDLLVS